MHPAKSATAAACQVPDAFCIFACMAACCVAMATGDMSLLRSRDCTVRNERVEIILLL